MRTNSISLKIYPYLDDIENNTHTYLKSRVLKKYKYKKTLYLYLLKRYLENNNKWTICKYDNNKDLYYLQYYYNKNFIIISKRRFLNLD